MAGGLLGPGDLGCPLPGGLALALAVEGQLPGADRLRLGDELGGQRAADRHGGQLGAGLLDPGDRAAARSVDDARPHLGVRAEVDRAVEGIAEAVQADGQGVVGAGVAAHTPKPRPTLRCPGAAPGARPGGMGWGGRQTIRAAARMFAEAEDATAAWSSSMAFRW